MNKKVSNINGLQNRLLFALYAFAVRIIRFCCSHYTLLLFALYAFAVRIIRFCCSHLNIKLCVPIWGRILVKNC